MQDKLTTKEQVDKLDTNISLSQKSTIGEFESYNSLRIFAKIICATDMVPSNYKSKPDSAFVAMAMGMELGLKPLIALRNIAVIGGRATIWGDVGLALVQKSDKLDYIEEWYNEEQRIAFCKVKRKGDSKEHITSFSEKQAEIAELWGKNVWKKYPVRMLQMRARWLALRDRFADVLGGFYGREELEAVDEAPKKSNNIVIPANITQLNDLIPDIEESVTLPQDNITDKAPDETQDENLTQELIIF